MTAGRVRCVCYCLTRRRFSLREFRQGSDSLRHTLFSASGLACRCRLPVQARSRRSLCKLVDLQPHASNSRMIWSGKKGTALRSQTRQAESGSAGVCQVRQLLGAGGRVVPASEVEAEIDTVCSRSREEGNGIAEERNYVIPIFFI